MKHLTLSLIIISYLSTLSAQKTDRWALELRHSTDIYLDEQYEYKQLPSGGVTGQQITDEIYNYSLSFQTSYIINPKLEVGVGLNYSNRDAKSICYCHICDKAAFPEAKVDVDFFGIPVFLRFQILKKSDSGLKIYAVAGLNQNLNANDHFKNGFRKWHSSPLLGLGGSLKLSPRLALAFEGDYTYTLQTVSEFSEYRYQALGLKLGLNFKI